MSKRRDRWFEINIAILDDRVAQQMDGRSFKEAFSAAINGQPSRLSNFVRPHHGRPSPVVWAKLRREVFERDGWSCTYCGAVENLECDHRLPVSRGGRNDLDNLVAACRSCNRSKRDRTPEEWRA